MTRLSFDAREQLQDAGITQAAWAREHFADGTWHGDRCGCPDDRCIGHHHDVDEDCGCLPALIGLSLHSREARALWRQYREAISTGDQVGCVAALAAALRWARRNYPYARAVSLDVLVDGREGISITYQPRWPAPEWAVPTGRDNEYRLLVWEPKDGAR
jgi:hypothetical protein